MQPDATDRLRLHQNYVISAGILRIVSLFLPRELHAHEHIEMRRRERRKGELGRVHGLEQLEEKGVVVRRGGARGDGRCLSRQVKSIAVPRSNYKLGPHTP